MLPVVVVDSPAKGDSALRSTMSTFAAVAAASFALAGLGTAALGAEVVVQNDSVLDGSAATICPCFVAGEHAAVWLTSPCDGNIVAIQVFWRSQLANQVDMIEQEINIRNPGNFPTPGTVISTLEAPVLTDGVLNEYRYFDQNQTIPISIPVTSGQVFVVDFVFFNDNVNTSGPSLVFDGNGVQGQNAIFAQGFGWGSNQFFGVSGDWFIRAVIDCAPATQGACCVPGNCVEDQTSADCTTLGGTFLGVGTTCAGSPCASLPGACCIPSTGGCVELSENDCVTQIGGNFQGPVTMCPDACVVPPMCPMDLDGDDDVDVFDFGVFAAHFGQMVTPNTDGDFDGDGDVDIFDFGLFAASFGCGT
jgi:hypothetical protein